MKKTLRRDKQRQLYALLQKPGEKTPTQIAKDLGIHVATFYRWKELFIEQVPQLKQSAHVVPMRRGDDIKPEVSTIEKFKEIPTVHHMSQIKKSTNHSILLIIYSIF